MFDTIQLKDKFTFETIYAHYKQEDQDVGLNWDAFLLNFFGTISNF